MDRDQRTRQWWIQDYPQGDVDLTKGCVNSQCSYVLKILYVKTKESTLGSTVQVNIPFCHFERLALLQTVAKYPASVQLHPVLPSFNSQDLDLPRYF